MIILGISSQLLSGYFTTREADIHKITGVNGVCEVRHSSHVNSFPSNFLCIFGDSIEISPYHPRHFRYCWINRARVYLFCNQDFSPLQYSYLLNVCNIDWSL